MIVDLFGYAILVLVGVVLVGIITVAALFGTKQGST